jgi:DNA-binding PadR family transcriptional regulator
MSEQVHDQLPLTEATLCILLSLAPGAKHGYAIMQDVAALSDGRVRLSTGTLYGALKRLLEQEWIERVGNESAGGREQKEYALTLRGRQVLAAETERLRALLQVAQQRAGAAR